MADWPATIVFPWQPCAVPVNQRTAFIGGSHRLSPRYRTGLERAYQEAMRHTVGIKPDGEHTFRAVLIVYRPDRRRRDLDGLVKLVLDALEGHVYEDDHQVRDLRVVDGGLDTEDPRLTLQVAPIAAEADFAVPEPTKTLD